MALQLVSNTNTSRVRFYEKGESRENSFIALPKDMVENLEEATAQIRVPWNRVVAFGAMAEAINAMIENGVKLFNLAKARLRDNSFKGDDGETRESYDLVCLELEGVDIKKVLAAATKKGSKKRRTPKAT